MSGKERRSRVANTMRASLAELIRRLSDPRLAAAGLVSVNHVELNRDMAIANVYVSFIGGADDKLPAAIAALSASAGRLRGPLGRQLNLKRTPELRFFADTGAEFRERLAEILESDAKRGGEGGESESDAKRGGEGEESE